MKISKLLVCALATLLALSPVVGYSKAEKSKGTGSHAGHVEVKGYTKKDGTYVAPHHRSAPNHTKKDNWSTQGNVNPDTGKEGTKKP